jgi:hypothetical protein
VRNILSFMYKILFQFVKRPSDALLRYDLIKVGSYLTSQSIINRDKKKEEILQYTRKQSRTLLYFIKCHHYSRIFFFYDVGENYLLLMSSMFCNPSQLPNYQINRLTNKWTKKRISKRYFFFCFF